MIVTVLASGSKGNCIYISTNNHHILIDVGMTCISIERKLKEINVNPSDIDTILVTHAHKDHIAGLDVFYKKYKPTVYLTDNIYKEANLKLASYKILIESIKLDDILITPIPTSHDAKDSRGYIIEHNNKSLVYITDTGYLNSKYFDLLKNKNIYIMESNHDVELLMNNEHYPHNIKIRILGDEGHLSNVDSSMYLSKLIGDNTKKIFLHHLSEENNTPDIALKTLKETLIKKNIEFDNISVASQNEISEVVTI